MFKLCRDTMTVSVDKEDLLVAVVGNRRIRVFLDGIEHRHFGVVLPLLVEHGLVKPYTADEVGHSLEYAYKNGYVLARHLHPITYAYGDGDGAEKEFTKHQGEDLLFNTHQWKELLIRRNFR